MLAKCLLLVYLPVIAHSKLTIEMYASNNEDEIHANLDGMDKHVISKEEENTFGITKEALKSLTKKYSGETCSGTFLKAPTPYGNVYQEYGWDEVEIKVTPTHFEILEFSAKPIVLTKTEHSNTQSHAMTVTTRSHKVVHEIAQHHWEDAPVLNLSQPISYTVNFGSGSVGGLASLRYTAPYGQDKVSNRSVNIEPNRRVTFSVSPNKTVVETLHATEVKMTIGIKYKATIEGQVFCHYDHKYREHYFWGYRAKELLRYSKQPYRKFPSEHLKLVFYVNARVQMHAEKK